MLMFSDDYGFMTSTRGTGFFSADLPYIILIIVITIAAFAAQAGVMSTFDKFKSVHNTKGMTAREAARAILDANGLGYVIIRQVPGKLSDNFNPRTNIVSLSESVCDSTSIAAIAIAAHECGHAIQHKENYAPVIARDALVPVTNIASRGWFFLCILGIFFGLSQLFFFGAIVFGIIALFHLVTLPVEFDASHRALKILGNEGFLTSNELPAARKVLAAAALTYIVSFAMALIQFLRMLALANRRR
jgi:Zn-dependent membrane protease YugP